jgi:hypothetical protein
VLGGDGCGTDAAHHRIRGGDVVRVFNERGNCLAGAVVTDAVRPRVVQLATANIISTGWYSTVTNRPPGLRIAAIPRAQLARSLSQMIAPYEQKTTRRGDSARAALGGPRPCSSYRGRSPSPTEEIGAGVGRGDCSRSRWVSSCRDRRAVR